MPVARLPWRLRFVWWRLIYEGSPFCRLEFWGGSYVFVKICTDLHLTVTSPSNSSTHLQRQTEHGDWHNRLHVFAGGNHLQAITQQCTSLLLSFVITKLSENPSHAVITLFLKNFICIGQISKKKYSTFVICTKTEIIIKVWFNG